MANRPTSSVPRVWASAITTIDALHQQLGSAPENRREVEDHLAAAEEALLDLQAPDIAGAIRKLELIWEGQLHGLDRESGRKLLVLDDLRRHATA